MTLLLTLILLPMGHREHGIAQAKPISRRVERSVEVAYRKVMGIPVRVIMADLNNPEVRVGVVTVRRLGTTEPIGDLLARARPTAAITGTYFGTRSKLPIGDIVIEGERVHFGGQGTALCITYDNRVRFVRPPRHRQVSWSEYRLVLGAGPRLIQKGKIALYPPGEGFRDPRVYAAVPRTAVGITRHNKLLMVVVTHPVRLRTLAKIMQQLGATDAIALDGGSSVSFYYRHTLMVAPGRRLTNLLVVYEKSRDYEVALPRLKPLRQYARR
jgi:hypothetical protein